MEWIWKRMEGEEIETVTVTIDNCLVKILYIVKNEMVKEQVDRVRVF